MMVMIATQTAVAGGADGVWAGSQSKDPITDKPTSIAFIGDQENVGSITVRCRSNGAEVQINANSPTFHPNDKQDVVIRFGQSAPVTVSAVAAEPKTLVLTRADREMLVPFTKSELIVVRFAGQFGRQITMNFQAVLPPNALHMVGRVLADCNIAPYPQEELERAKAELSKQSSGATRQPKQPPR